MICDHRMKITNVVTKWLGSVNDSRIFKNSRICAEYEQGDYMVLITIFWNLQMEYFNASNLLKIILCLL